VITALLLASLVAPPPPAAADGPSLRFGHFGEVAVYRPAGLPARTALFYSGDGGWNKGVVDMAHALAASGTLVLGVDTPKYFKALDASGDRCTYLAGDAEGLSQYAQKQLGLPAYQTPLLVGYSSGAAAVYAALAQAPANTFQGALSLGFDPKLPTRTGLCDRNGLTTVPTSKGDGLMLRPASSLPAPWIVLHGSLDQVWPAESALAFVRAVPEGEFVSLPKVGHGFSVADNWLPQFKEALARLTPAASAAAAPTAAEIANLPVIELPVPGSTIDYFAVVLSGDGGWASIDKQIGEELTRSGVPVVGFNSLQYLWSRKTPDQIANDLDRLIRYYQEAWHKRDVILVGYSRGADVLPLMVSRLPSSQLDRIRLIAFLGLQHSTDLEFRLGDLLSARSQPEYPLLPEIQKLAGRPMLCVYGTKEGNTLCPDLPAGLAVVVELKGGHHFDGDYQGLARLVMEHVK
jgi:type IV secretory pathway VirJ component